MTWFSLCRENYAHTGAFNRKHEHE
jgi:hypothetical protein